MEVKTLKIEVSGEGITAPIVLILKVEEIKGDIKIEKIPTGPDRKFKVEALNEKELPLFSGEAAAPIEAEKSVEIIIEMKKVGETPVKEGDAVIKMTWTK